MSGRDLMEVCSRALVLVTLFSTAARSLGEQPAVTVVPLPDWVHPCEWSLPASPTGEGDSYGTRYLLYEKQDNPAREEEYLRIVLLMENEAGVQDSGSLTFSFDPSYQELLLHRVRIHRNGEVLDRLDLSDVKIIQPERDLAGHLYTGKHTALLFLEDLRVGDALEYAFTVRGVNPILTGHYASRFFVQSGAPVDRQRFRVVWPTSETLHVRQHLREDQPRVEAWEEGNEYVWDYGELPAIAYEDRLPASYEPYPYIELSDFESWSRVVDWALPLYVVESTNLPSELRDLMAKWQQDAASDEEKTRRALEFVQDELRYTGIELGPDSYRPAPPRETFQRRYGDCKAKSLLLCTLLGSMRIEAYPALVNSSVREAVARRLPSPFVFDHVIVKVVLNGETVWVDPARSHQGGQVRNRYLPPLGKALIIRRGVRQLEDIPGPDPSQVLQRVISTFRMTNYTSPVVFSVKTACYGSEADSMRDYLARTDQGEIAEDYLNFYARYYPGISDPHPLEVVDDRELNVLTVLERYQIRDLWQPDDSSGRLQSVFYPESMMNVLPDPTTRLRKMPLRISFPLRREQDVFVHLPDGDWDIPSLEDAVRHNAFAFQYRRELTGSTVHFRYECETKAPEVLPEDAAGFLKKAEEMDDLLGDILYRPDTGPGSILTHMNWLMVALAGLSTTVFLAGTIWFWRATRTTNAAPPPVLEEMHLQGLGGWLILVGIGLCLGPIVRVFLVAQNWESFFSMQVWYTVAMSGGDQYHPLWGPLLIFELLGNVALMGLNVLALCLFFARRRVFPRIYIAFLVLNAMFQLLDHIAAGAIPYLASDPELSSARDLVRAVVVGAIWTAYMLKSRRVKVTFVR